MTHGLRAAAIGSSPRLRGTALRPGLDPSPDRFIPAPAGNSPQLTRGKDHTPVHPRACGEQKAQLQVDDTSTGSSPRLRGTGRSRRPDNPDHRFIPAPAGNRSSFPHWACSGSVHPRACGEQITAARIMSSPVGSSPRLRGTGASPWTRSISGRFIPAPAGNRGDIPSRPHRHTVHPRACGEQSTARPLLSPPNGSSPRLRGTDKPIINGLQIGRFIPAPAGNSSRELRHKTPDTVHPRACGEQSIGPQNPI